METLSLLHDSTKAAIELTLQDNNQRLKKAILLVDLEDDWLSENPNDNDVLNVFASAMMQAAKKDTTAFTFQVKCFRCIDGTVQKTREYIQFVKHEGEFKSAIIGNNGSIEFL